jgi:hypothetical protein
VREVEEAVDWFASVYLSHWDSIVDVPCDIGCVRRLKARHDAASRYAAVQWNTGEEYKSAVGPCYSELVGLALAYSAFDYMRDVCFDLDKKGWKASREWYGTLDFSPFDGAMQAVNALFPDRALALHLVPMVREHLAKALTDTDDPWPGLRISSAMRHAFVHGKLSPSGGGVDAASLDAVAYRMRRALLEVVTLHMMRKVYDPIRAVHS